jgi:tRNA (guanine-N7-)-methyltransferase
MSGGDYLGIEYAREFYLYAADRIRRRVQATGGAGELTNVRMLNTDAFEFLCWRVPGECAHVIHLYFADPWPKTRHHKRRMVRDEFLRQCRRILIPGGELRIVTDHADYWAWMEEHFAKWAVPLTTLDSPGGFVRLPFDRAESAGQNEVVGTNFERKYKREGRPFYGTILRKP